MPFCSPMHFFWMFPIAGIGLMIAFLWFIIRPIAQSMTGTLCGSGPDSRSGDAVRAPADILRERYAKGEINREQYREALVDFLKDRYVHGEITLDEFEERVEKLFSSQTYSSSTQGNTE